MAFTLDIRTSRPALAAFALIGVFWGAFAASVPEFKARIGLGDAAFGALLLVAALGAMVAMVAAPRVSVSLPRLALPLAGAMMALAAAPAGTVATMAGFAVLIIAISMTAGLLDILANARIGALEAETGRTLMSLNHAGYSFVYAAAAAATGIARELGLPLWLWFAGIGLVGLALVPLMMSPRSQPGAPTSEASGGQIGRHAWLAGAVVLIAFYLESASEGWSAIHIERTLGGRASEGALGPAMLGLTMGVGRLLGHFLTGRMGEMRMIYLAAFGAALGLAVAAAATSPAMAYLGFGLMGLGVSVIAPLAIALAGRGAPVGRRTLAISRAATIGYIGFFIGPPLMGLISEVAGLRAAFGASALVVTLIPLALLPMMGRARFAPAR